MWQKAQKPPLIQGIQNDRIFFNVDGLSIYEAIKLQWHVESFFVGIINQTILLTLTSISASSAIGKWDTPSSSNSAELEHDLPW